ncbi:MAG: hypothetical protein M9921_00465 [Fimbriimonadaceae bacterium]|nr:hypothetical protein [Chthonomonadaceae bacterium]MCO5295307.1 hypothetical protein [Fimbriimonadaceae bacterium]
MRRTWLFVLAGLAALATGWVLQVGQPTPGKQADGSVWVPTHQRLTKVGSWIELQGTRPKQVEIRGDGVFAALCTGRVRVFASNGEPQGDIALNTAGLGLAWSGDGATLYASMGDGKVATLGQVGGKWTKTAEWKVDAPPEADLSGPKSGNPQVNGLAWSPGHLYVALGIRNALVDMDPATGSVQRVVATGVAPYHVRVSSDGRWVAVSNRAGAVAAAGEASADSAGTNVKVDPRTDASQGGSISLVDTAAWTAREIPVGRQPSGAAFTGDGKTLVVADSDSDTISVLDVDRGEVTQTVSVRPPTDPGFGQMPTDVALSSDGKTLFVACGGLNAVLVADFGRSIRVRGFVPTAWYPIGLARRDGAMVVACSKGIGSRREDRANKWGPHDSVGVVQVLDDADWSDLKLLSGQVADNNRWNRETAPRPGQAPRPVPERVGEPSVFRHVVYIIKENLSYDSLLGDVPRGRGDPSLCMFGKDVSPNHHKLADEFVLLDNAYASGTNSADGHQWTSSSVANAYSEQNYSAYARSYPYDGGDPLAYSPAGFLWTAAVRAGKRVRVFGEFVNKPKIAHRETGKSGTWTELWNDYRTGSKNYEITSDTDNAALKPLLHPHYIGFPTVVSDQWRADQFLGDLKRWESEGAMPDLCVMLLPNDHTTGTRAGYPTPRAQVADNDLALGRIVEGLTHSKFWAETLILVVEDDTQLGLDHVDGHRIPAFCISPYTRRGAVVSETYDHASFVRTIGLVLGFPALNRFDRTATPLSACFASTPNDTPYDHAANIVPLDEMNKAPSELEGTARRLALACGELDWSEMDVADPETVTRAAWQSVFPERPFPEDRYERIDDDD